VTAKEFRVGIIGLGRIGAVHVEAWDALEGARVVAACDSSDEACAAAASKGLAAFSDPRMMLEAVEVDAVGICAPPNQHEPLAEVCFAMGVPVLCEKPLAADGTAATRLVESAGLEVVRISYLFGSLLPLMLGVRTFQRLLRPFREPSGDADLSVPPAPVNAVLTALVAAETALARRVTIPFGSSLLIVARKK